MNKLLYQALILIVSGGFATGQNEPTEITLSLEECIALAHEKSIQSRVVNNKFQIAALNFTRYQASGAPQIGLSGNAPGIVRAINSVTQDDGTIQFVEQSTGYSSASLDVSQEIPWLGSTIRVGSGLSRIDIFGQSSSYIWQASPLLISFDQPLFKHNFMRWNRKIKPLEYRIAEKQKVEDLEKLSIEFTNLFFDLFTASIRLENAKKNVAINDTLMRTSKGRYNVGKIGENDLLQSELALMKATSELERSGLNYKVILKRMQNELFEGKEGLISPIAPSKIAKVEIQVSAAIAQAKAHNSSYDINKLIKLQAEQKLSKSRLDNGFSADMSISFGLNQTANNVANLYNNTLDQQKIGLYFSLPILDWGKGRSQVEIARIELENAVLHSNKSATNLEEYIFEEVANFLWLQSQIAISEKAREIADKRFDVAKNRYLIGKVDITDVLLAQTEKDQANITYAETLRKYWTTHYRIRQITMYDYMKGQKISADNN